MGFELAVGQKIGRSGILSRLLDIQFERNDIDLAPGRFRVKGDTIDIVPGYFNDIIRVELFGEEIERIREVDKIPVQKKGDEVFLCLPRPELCPPETLAGRR